MPMPTRIEEITAEWLGQALKAHGHDVEIGGLRHDTVIHGSATKVRVCIDYRNGNPAGLPQAFWVKIGLEPHSDGVRDLLFYDVETECYARILPRFAFNTPRCYAHQVEVSPPQSALVIEDLSLRPATMNIATKPLSIAETAAGLRALAGIHAATWEGRNLDGSTLRPALTWGEKDILTDFVARAPQLLSVARGYSVPVCLHDPGEIARAHERYAEAVLQGPQCLVHGDAHIGNSFTEADGAVGFLDWQCASTGHWSHDLGYFMVTALDVPDRREAELRLLQAYLEALASHGVEPPDWDEALAAYRRSMVFTFLIWLGNGDEFQPPEVNNACFARAGAAVTDHGGWTAII